MCINPQKTADLFTFTKEILNGKLNFLRSRLLTKKKMRIYQYFSALAHGRITEVVFNYSNICDSTSVIRQFMFSAVNYFR